VQNVLKKICSKIKIRAVQIVEYGRFSNLCSYQVYRQGGHKFTLYSYGIPVNRLWEPFDCFRLGAAGKASNGWGEMTYTVMKSAVF